VHKAKLITDWHTSLLGQATLAAFIEQGAFARHIRKARSVYAMRHELVPRIVARGWTTCSSCSRPTPACMSPRWPGVSPQTTSPAP
jgi:DNA-binding transcriptional MocR family regulator